MDLTPCFGFGGCDQHASCARYHAIETSSSRTRYGHCPVDANGQRTLFVPMFIARERRAANAFDQHPIERRQAGAQEAA